MTDENRGHVPRALIVLILLVPLFVWIGREILGGRLIWYFRAVDFADMTILTPIYIAVVLYLWIYMHRNNATTAMLAAFGAFGALFLVGQGQHVAGNSINTFMTEVRDYKPITPDDAYELIFFIDEILSHWVLFGAMIGLISTWLVFDARIAARPLLPDKLWLLLLAGLIFGLTLGYALIEARTPYIIVAVLGALGGTWLWLWRQSGQSFAGFIENRPYRKFVLILMLTTTGMMLIWLVVFGGFVQPSEVGL